MYIKIAFYEASYKVLNTGDKKPNLEVFDKNSLLIDLMDYFCSPVSCQVLRQEDIQHITNPKLAKILRNDPMARYYRAKKGMIMRIVRRSINNGVEVAYRRVIDGKQVFK